MIRQLRMISGLVLFTYVAVHLVNHSLGIVSVAAMDAMLRWVYPAWTSILGRVALYGAFLTHLVLAFYALWERRTLRPRRLEALQYSLGFSIPLLAATHVTGTRINDTFFGGDGSHYSKVLMGLWYGAPLNGVVQIVLLFAAWTHVCIGLRFWLRLRPWYARAQPLLYAVALLLPVLALMGFIAGEREIGGMLARDPDLLVKTLQSRTSPGKEPVLLHVAWGIRITLLSAIAGIFIARFIRQRWQRRGGVSRITYPDGRWIEVPHGFTVLEASQRLGVPHTSICGGKGRCSTCRIRVQADPGTLPPPSLDEQRVLRAIRAPPNVRLACQLRPRGHVTIVPLVLSSKVRRGQFRAPVHAEAREQEIVILFADLRDFTQLAETRLPYDVVFILNRYFEEMGQAIEAAGGQVDKFIGDGLMALFGLHMSSPQASNQALVAARLMFLRLAELNRALAPNLDIPLRMGIGIHKGPAIVGEMGYGRTRSLTALGDTVNVASRLQALSKSHQCELVVSEDLLRSAGLDLPDEARREMEIRGRGAPIALYMIAAIDNITVKIPGPAASSATGSTTSKADLLILVAERFGIRPK